MQRKALTFNINYDRIEKDGPRAGMPITSQEWLSQEWEESTMTSMNSGDQLVAGLANISKARAELREVATIIASLAGDEILSWIDRVDDEPSLYFSCVGTKGWLLTTNKIDLWEIVYTDYNGGNYIFYTSSNGHRDLPGHVVLEARANLHVLVDGLADRFLRFRSILVPFLNAADK